MTERHGRVCGSRLTGSFHRQKDVATATIAKGPAMLRLSLAALLALSLAACATQPPPDLTPPQQRLDAKTTLESGPRR